MIIVSGALKIDPTDRDAAADLMAVVVAATRAEDGNLSYGFYEDPEEPGSFKIYEEWDNAEAMGGHMGQPHMAEFLGGMGGLKLLGTEIFSHEVTNTTQVM